MSLQDGKPVMVVSPEARKVFWDRYDEAMDEQDREVDRYNSLSFTMPDDDDDDDEDDDPAEEEGKGWDYDR